MDCTTYLLKVLGTYKVFEYNTHLMHWEVTGPINKAFHTLMQEYYEYAEDVMDDIAERVRMLWGHIPLKMCDLVNMSDINFMTSIPDMQSWIQIALKMHDYLIDFLKKGIIMWADKEDFYTEDILRGICARHEKQKRLLESRVGKTLPSKPMADGWQKADSEGDKSWA